MKKKHLYFSALFVAGVVIVYLVFTFYAEKTVQRNIDAEIQNIRQIADVRYDDFKLDIIDSRIRFENIIITPRFWNEEIRIDKGIFYQPKTEDNIPSNIRFNLEGIYLNTARSGTFLKSYIESMGFEKLGTEEIVREGKKDEQIISLIDEDEDIAILVLGASKDPSGPGPLISALAAGKFAAEFPIPITIVPGGLGHDEIKGLA